MVMEPLSQDMIKAGRELLERLEDRVLPISWAFWLYLSEPDLWRLIVASPIVAESGPRKAYQLIQKELRAAPQMVHAISLSDISAVEPDNLLVAPFRGLNKLADLAFGKTLVRSAFNGHFVEGAYIYKLT